HAADVQHGGHGGDQHLCAVERHGERGLAHHATEDGDDVVVDRGGRGEQVVGARVEAGSRLDADYAVVTDKAVDVDDGSGHRQVNLGLADDVGEHLVFHGEHAERYKVARSSDAAGRGTADICKLRVRQVHS